jgi:hypothetical protein
MKEAFVTIQQLIDETKLLGDMQLQAYLTSLDNSQRTDYINSNISSTVNSVLSSKSSNYSRALDQVTGSDNNITSSAYYLTRSRDLTNLATSVDDMINQELSASLINNGLNKRQSEINEWANRNKLDTLYFLQVLFISLSIIGILCYLVSSSIINNTLFKFVSYVIVIIAMLVLILRWRYTRVARDSRYWHKARFPSQK